MMFVRRIISLSLIVFLALFLPVTGLSAPKFKIEPKVSAGWRSDTNFYKEEFGEREVHTYLVRPGIYFGYETSKSLIELDYTLDAYYYDDKDPYPPGQKTEDYVGHTLSLNATTKPFDRLTLGLEESYYGTSDPVQSDVLSNKQVREEYSINRLTPRIIYEFGPKFTAALRHRWTELNYESSLEEDATEHRGMFDLIYNLRRRLSLDLRYQHWKMDYHKTTSDYTSDQIELLLKKQFHYFSLSAGGGYHDRRFDASNMGNIDTPSFRIELEGQNPPAPAKSRSHLLLSFVQDFNIWHDGFDYYVARRVSLEAGRVFKGKLPFIIRAAYQNSDYENFMGLTPSGKLERREDDGYGIEASLGYFLTDWLTLTGAAGYEERNSNLAGFDYENEYYMITLDFAYDLGSK
jgi:hypothetical protein